MQFTRASHYGLRAMIDLALHCDQGPVRVKDISRREGIPEKYLEKLMHRLKRKHIVRGVRGPGGGYVLGKSSKEITAKDILDVVEGPTAPVICLRHDYSPGKCARERGCTSRVVWEQVARKVDEVLAGLTLAELVEQARATEGR